MKQPVPFPVTEENFPQCWDFVDKCRRTGRRQSLIARCGGLLSNLVFLLALIFSHAEFFMTGLTILSGNFLKGFPFTLCGSRPEPCF